MTSHNTLSDRTNIANQVSHRGEYNSHSTLSFDHLFCQHSWVESNSSEAPTRPPPPPIITTTAYIGSERITFHCRCKTSCLYGRTVLNLACLWKVIISFQGVRSLKFALKAKRLQRCEANSLFQRSPEQGTVHNVRFYQVEIFRSDKGLVCIWRDQCGPADKERRRYWQRKRRTKNKEDSAGVRKVQPFEVQHHGRKGRSNSSEGSRSSEERQQTTPILLPTHLCCHLMSRRFKHPAICKTDNRYSKSPAHAWTLHKRSSTWKISSDLKSAC